MRVLKTDDNTNIACGSYDGYVCIKRLGERKQEIIVECLTESQDTLAITRNNKHIISSSGNSIKILNIQEKQQKTPLQGHTSPVKSIEISNDGTLIVSGSGRKRESSIPSDNSVRLWNFHEKKEIAVLEGHTGAVKTLVISRDNTYIVSGSRDKTVMVWNIKERTQDIIFAGHTNTVQCVGMTSDNSVIVSGSDDTTIRIWSLRERVGIAVLIGHSHCIKRLLLTNDNKYVISGSYDKTVRVWNLENKTEEDIFSSHNNLIASLAITTDSKYIITASLDNSVRIWRIKAQDNL